MSEEGEKVTGELKRELRLRDLVLFNLAAVIAISWLATSAKNGPSALTLWLLVGILFLVPESVAVVELSSRFPKEGGIYSWTRETLGEGHGFLCGWCYWLSNILAYPAMLIPMAVAAAFVIGKGETDLSDKWAFVLPFSLVALWLAAILNIVGLRIGKWVQNLGGIGVYIPGVMVVALGVYAFLTRPSENPITWEGLKPDFASLSSLKLCARLAFAFAGLELSSTMAGETQEPRRNLPRSIYIAAPLIVLVYILGTASVLWLVPSGRLNIVAGPFQAISNGSSLLGGFSFAAPLAAAIACVGISGGVGAWLTGSARVAFVIGLDRYFPPAFGRSHPRWGTPYIVILFQATIATFLLLIAVLGKGTTVENAFLILIDTSLLIYFLPFVYLFICFFIHRYRSRDATVATSTPGGRRIALTVAMCGLLITVFALMVAAVPPPDSPEPLAFVAKVGGGAIIFVLAGVFIYSRAKRRQRNQDPKIEGASLGSLEYVGSDPEGAVNRKED